MKAFGFNAEVSAFVTFLALALLLSITGCEQQQPGPPPPPPVIKPSMTYNVKINEDGSSDIMIQMHSTARTPAEAWKHVIEAVNLEIIKP